MGAGARGRMGTLMAMPAPATPPDAPLTVAVLPVKRFSRAKQRLGASVGDELRAALAHAMACDVLAALGETGAIDRIVVVTGEHAIARAARGQGATVLADDNETSQSAAATIGIREALVLGAARVLCVPGDCPALDPSELERLLATQPEREVVIVPDRHGTGTNGLLLCPPDVIDPAFGPGSCERHRGLAARAGVNARIERLPSLLLDVDTGADLAALRAKLGEHAGRAARTRAVLAAHRTGGASVAALA